MCGSESSTQKFVCKTRLQDTPCVLQVLPVDYAVDVELRMYYFTQALLLRPQVRFAVRCQRDAVPQRKCFCGSMLPSSYKMARVAFRVVQKRGLRVRRFVSSQIASVGGNCTHILSFS